MQPHSATAGKSRNSAVVQQARPGYVTMVMLACDHAAVLWLRSCGTASGVAVQLLHLASHSAAVQQTWYAASGMLACDFMPQFCSCAPAVYGGAAVQPVQLASRVAVLQCSRPGMLSQRFWHVMMPVLQLRSCDIVVQQCSQCSWRVTPRCCSAACVLRCLGDAGL